MRHLWIFAMCLMLLSLSFAQSIGSEVSMGKAEAKAVAIIDSQVVFKLDKNNPLQNVSATKLNSKSYEIKIGKDKLFEFEVKNKISADNRLLDCGLLTCDFVLELNPSQAMRFDAEQITGGWQFGDAQVQKVFFYQNQTYTEYEPIFETSTEQICTESNATNSSYCYEQSTSQEIGTTAHERSRLIEQTDFNQLTLKPGEKPKIIIRFSKPNPTQAVDIYPTIYGHQFKEWAWWDEAPYYQILNTSMQYGASAISSTLTNYVALVRLDTSNASIFNTSSQVGLAFTHISDNSTRLRAELDSGWGTNNTLIWVGNINQTSSSQIVAWADKDSAEAINYSVMEMWRNATYVSVFHMNEAGGTTLIDSAGRNNLTKNNTAHANTTAPNMIDKALSLYAIQDGHYYKQNPIGLPTGANPGTDTIRLIPWDSSEWNSIIGYGATNWRTYLAKGFGGLSGFRCYSQGWSIASSACDAQVFNSFQFIGARYTGTAAQVIINTTQVSSINTAWNTDVATFLYLGTAQGSTIQHMNGTMDEVRIRNVSSSDDWLKAEFALIYNDTNNWKTPLSPLNQSPTITPSPAFTNTTLQFNTSASGLNGNNITTINYTIYLNGSSYLTNQKTGNFSDGEIVSLHNQSGFAKGSTLILQVASQLSNGTWFNATNSSQLTISNTNPALASLIFTANGSAFQLGPVQANITFQDIDGDNMTCSYNWFKNGANQTSLAGNIACANGTQFTLNAPPPFIVGDNWSIRVWATDGTDTSSSNDSANTTIQNYTSNLTSNTTSPQYDIYANLHQLNLTMQGGASINASLTIGNQSQIATSSNAGNNWVFNASIRPTQVSVPTTQNASWIFTTILANGTQYHQNHSYLFQVIPGGLLACNATITTQSINYTIRDYQTGSAVSASYSSVYTSSTVSRSASGSASAYGWCIAPYNSSIDVSFTETYSATGYSTIQLTRAITASNSSQNLTIYLFNSSNTKSTQLKVLQAPALQVPGAYITVEAYQAPSNYSFITSCNTDATGTCLVSLIPNIQEYRYNITISGQTFSFGPESLACSETASLCFRTFTIGSSGVIDYFNNPINGNCSFSNSTSILTCSSNDTSNTITQGNLSLYLVIGNNSNSTVSTLLCNQTYSGSAGTLQCSVPTDDGDYYFAFYGTDSANAAYYFDSGWITDRRDTAQNFGYEGLLIAFIFIICVAAVGFYSLVVSIILMDIAILAMQLMGIVQFGWEIVVGFWLISAMLIYKLRM